MVKNDLSARKKVNRSPLIVAHRGVSAHAPENTLAAMRMVLDSEADGVELDVRLASDGVPVVIHDATLNRTGRCKGHVSAFSSEELCQIDVGSWFNAKYPKLAKSDFVGETISSLWQVLQVLDDFRGLIYIELKTETDNFHQLVKAVCDTVRFSRLLPQIIIKSFDLAAVSETKHHLPRVQTAALFGQTVADLLRRRQNLITTTCELGADQISLHYSLVTKQLAGLASEAGLPITIWTTDNPTWLAKCQQLGIRALITNDPVKLLRSRNKIHF